MQIIGKNLLDEDVLKEKEAVKASHGMKDVFAMTFTTSRVNEGL